MDSRVARVDNYKWDCREIRKIANTPLEGSKDHYIIGDFQNPRLIDNGNCFKLRKSPVFLFVKKFERVQFGMISITCLNNF